jgi:hypothetical protein
MDDVLGIKVKPPKQESSKPEQKESKEPVTLK